MQDYKTTIINLITVINEKLEQYNVPYWIECIKHNRAVRRVIRAERLSDDIKLDIAYINSPKQVIVPLKIFTKHGVEMQMLHPDTEFVLAVFYDIDYHNALQKISEPATDKINNVSSDDALLGASTDTWFYKKNIFAKMMYSEMYTKMIGENISSSDAASDYKKYIDAKNAYINQFAQQYDEIISYLKDIGIHKIPNSIFWWKTINDLVTKV